MLTLIAALLIAAAESREVEVARKALSRELGIPPDALKVRSSKPMQWPDSSLGCPRKRAQYLQVVTKGREVVLESGGREYLVHVAGAQAVVCPPKRAESESRFSAAARLRVMARKDLAARLKINEESIETTFLRPRTWPDASLGCPEPGKSYAQMETPGYVIELQANGKTYTYHSDMTHAVPCGEAR